MKKLINTKLKLKCQTAILGSRNKRLGKRSHRTKEERMNTDMQEKEEEGGGKGE
jgi:hypothetical protein